MAEDDLTIFLDAAKEAARRGAAVLESWRARFQVREKGRFEQGFSTEGEVAQRRVA